MKRTALSLITTLVLAAASTGWPQTAYPNKPVKLVLGFTPGSAADVVARIVAPKVSEALGQQFIVGHKPGAGFARQG